MFHCFIIFCYPPARSHRLTPQILFCPLCSHRSTTIPLRSFKNGKKYSAKKTQALLQLAVGASLWCCTAPSTHEPNRESVLHIVVQSVPQPPLSLPRSHSSSAFVLVVTSRALQTCFRAEGGSAAHGFQSSGPRVGQGRQAACLRFYVCMRVHACMFACFYVYLCVRMYACVRMCMHHLHSRTAQLSYAWSCNHVCCLQCNSGRRRATLTSSSGLEPAPPSLLPC